MEKLTFNDWWLEFINTHLNDRDSGHGAIQQLTNYIRNLPQEKRTKFLDELVIVVLAQKKDWGIAVSVLEANILDNQVSLLRDAYLRQQDLSYNEDWKCAVLRVLASSKDKDCVKILEKYVLETNISGLWTSVPWALWKNHKLLFSKAWARYFITIEESVWKGTCIVQAFLHEPEAVASLQEILISLDSRVWSLFQNALYKEIDAPWIDINCKNRLGDILKKY